MAAFPTSKIELHQWFNSILLGIVGFFVIQTYNTVVDDHEVLAKHETRISVIESRMNGKQTAMSLLEAILPKETKVESE